jgi:sterol 3beta-glucosyltransferase
MRVTMCTFGSLGDVQPTIALAKGLKEAGHEVRLFTHETFADLARAHNVSFLPLPGDPREALITTAAVGIGKNPLRMARWLRQNFRPVLHDLFRTTLDAVAGSDLVVSASLSFTAFHFAEKLGIPAISTQCQPSTVTRAFAGALLPPAPDWLPSRA